MIIKDYYFNLSNAGYFLGIVPMGDEHIGADTHNRNYFPWLKMAIADMRRMFKVKIGIIKLGDELEYDRKSFSDKLQGTGKKSDRKGHEKMAKDLVNKILYRYDSLFSKDDLKMAAVSGNHKVEFTIGHKEFFERKKDCWLNSSHMMAEKLGFPYAGDGHCKINLHIKLGPAKRTVYKILCLHGHGKGSSPESDLKEFKQIRSMYGELDMIIKAHSHKPLTTHFGRYDTKATEKSDIIKIEETTIINVGSGRGAMGIGFTDYGEKGEYTPIPVRFPFIALRAINSNSGFEIRAIPITF